MNDINIRIEVLRKKIEQNEHIQDRWIAQHGEMNEGIFQKHEKLCDEMEELCSIRRTG